MSDSSLDYQQEDDSSLTPKDIESEIRLLRRALKSPVFSASLYGASNDLSSPSPLVIREEFTGDPTQFIRQQLDEERAARLAAEEMARAARDELTRLRQQIQESNNRTNAMCSELKSQAQASEDMAMELGQRLRVSEARVAALEDDNAQLERRAKLEASELTDRIAAIQASAERTTREAVARLKSMEEELLASQKLQAELRDRLNISENQIADMTVEHAKTAADLVHSRSDADQARADHQNSVNQANEERSALEQSLRQSNKERDEAERALDEARKQVQDLSTRLDLAQREEESLVRRLREAERARDDAHAQLDDKTRRISGLELDLEVAQARIQRLTDIQESQHQLLTEARQQVSAARELQETLHETQLHVASLERRCQEQELQLSEMRSAPTLREHPFDRVYELSDQTQGALRQLRQSLDETTLQSASSATMQVESRSPALPPLPRPQEGPVPISRSPSVDYYAEPAASHLRAEAEYCSPGPDYLKASASVSPPLTPEQTITPESQANDPFSALPPDIREILRQYRSDTQAGPAAPIPPRMPSPPPADEYVAVVDSPVEEEHDEASPSEESEHILPPLPLSARPQQIQPVLQPQQAPRRPASAARPSPRPRARGPDPRVMERLMRGESAYPTRSASTTRRL